MRGFLAVLAGAVVWALVWLALNQGLLAWIPDAFAIGRPITSAGWLVFLLVFSALLSVGAGYVTGWVGRGKEIPCALALGVVQTALGIVFQVQSWDLMPLWYHLLFLASLLPGNVLGGALRASALARNPAA
ncbi:MAG: hypothetical protein MJB57_07410 [Gemmatimonadetes bacterium]|nr:hypothetical protein [Gemmatimonadota bacterium]